MDHPGGPMCGGSTPWQEGPQDEVTMTKAKRVFVPSETHIINEPCECHQRKEKGDRRCVLMGDRACSDDAFPAWCPLDNHDPDCPVLDPWDLLDQAAGCQRDLIVALKRLIAKAESATFIQDADEGRTYSHLLTAIELAREAIVKSGGKL